MAPFLKKAALSATLALIAGALVLPQAFAQKGVMSYRLYQDAENPTYIIAKDAMKDVYKDFPWDEVPLIGIAEIPLNNDPYPEIISYPLEDEMQTGNYCKRDLFCPHYITEIRGRHVRNLGTIDAYTIARGDRTENGYWTLKVYTKDPEEDPYYFEEYHYVPGKDAYEPVKK